MAIKLKSPWEIERMREAGALLTEVVEEVARHVEPGVSTWELDQIAYIRFASVYRDFGEARDFEEFASAVQGMSGRDAEHD